jgi:ADP-dependent NAD(P)H-hydrate dehydratase / NAD(P)H-hydrate epimerase
MITVKEMKVLEEQAAQQGVSIEELMENAGKAVFETVKEKFELDGRQIVVFCGQGNNGGDGFVAARYFAEENNVLVLFFGDKEKLSEEAEVNYNKIKDAVIEIRDKNELEEFHFQEKDYIFIDALLGTGISGDAQKSKISGTPVRVREPFASAIDLFNSIKAEKIAVDVPSGLNADTGSGEKVCVVDLIVCFHDLKKGLEKFKKKTVVVDIGIPDMDVKISKAGDDNTTI